MALSTAQKAFYLLDDIKPCGDVWVKLSNFDPLHGRSELNYAEKMGWIERKPGQVKLTESGYVAHTKKKYKSDQAAE